MPPSLPEARRRGAGSPPAPSPRRKPWATASRSLGSGAAGVRTCRLVALALPDPGCATRSRPLIHPGSDRKQRVDHQIRFPGQSTCPALLWEGRLKFLYRSHYDVVLEGPRGRFRTQRPLRRIRWLCRAPNRNPTQGALHRDSLQLCFGYSSASSCSSWAAWAPKVSPSIKMLLREATSR